MSESNELNLKIEQLKDKYIKYFEDVPIQKYAAMYVKRDEDTIIRWKNDDKDFADRVNQSKAEWIRKKMLKLDAKTALERLEKEYFSEKIIYQREDPRELILKKFGLIDKDGNKVKE
ncbi:MAG: hypothetical protein ACXWLH_05285 [Candidatus Saccharimonadales bacterium]